MNNVVFTKVSIFRNLKDYKFVPKLEADKQNEITEKLSAALKGKMNLTELSSINLDAQKVLKTNRLVTNTRCNNIYLGEQENLCVVLFDGEHLTINSVEQGFNKSAFVRASELARELSNKISFAYTDNYGYLMSDLTKIGAGIKLECDIDFSAIVELEKIEQVKQNVRKLGYQLTPTNNKSIFTLSTLCNLGLTEAEIFDEFEKTINKLQDLETESAKMLDATNHEELIDRTNRTLAVLKAAYLMNYDELKTHISVLRTGLNLGLVNLSAETLNKLQNLSISERDFMSKTEMIDLAKQVQKILKEKGENNV